MIAAASKRYIALQARRVPLVANSKILHTNSTSGGYISAFSTIRWHSSVTSGSCPHHASGSEGTVNPRVEFVDIPKLPFLGTLIPQYSKSVPYDPTNVYDYWYDSRKKFGDFYCMGLPGVGNSISGEVYVLTDPNEFMKVLRKEGSFPYGAIQIDWPFVDYYNDAKASGSPGGAAGSALFSRGADWQRIRRFMQSDLLGPAAAKGYVPGMIRACQIASEGAPLHSKSIESFTTFCSFDMFSSVIFGNFPGLASGKEAQEENERFCNTTLEALGTVTPMLMNPLLRVMKTIGIKPKVYADMEEKLTISRNTARDKMKEFKLRKERGELVNDFEKSSYASLSIDRFLASEGEEDALEEEDMAEILVVALIAALDTTSALLNWCLIHLAMNPEIQEELHREVAENVASSGTGELTEGCFAKSKNVYLDAFLRESQRMTSPVGFSLGKENVMEDVEIHGKTIPKGSMFILDQRSVGMDPAVVKDPDVFDPTRWFPEEVEQRKGTPAEVLDHPLYKSPFSAGARKCPGSRVANYEAKILLSQLLLDWKISIADTVESKPKTWRDIPYYQGLTIQPEVPELSFERRH